MPDSSLVSEIWSEFYRQAQDSHSMFMKTFPQATKTENPQALVSDVAYRRFLLTSEESLPFRDESDSCYEGTVMDESGHEKDIIRKALWIFLHEISPSLPVELAKSLGEKLTEMGLEEYNA